MNTKIVNRTVGSGERQDYKCMIVNFSERDWCPRNDLPQNQTPTPKPKVCSPRRVYSDGARRTWGVGQRRTSKDAFIKGPGAKGKTHSRSERECRHLAFRTPSVANPGRTPTLSGTRPRTGGTRSNRRIPRDVQKRASTRDGRRRLEALSGRRGINIE